MKPSSFTRHLNRAHPQFKEKDLDFFKRRETVLNTQQLDKSGTFFQQNSAAAKASYKVSLIITQQKKTGLTTNQRNVAGHFSAND